MGEHKLSSMGDESISKLLWKQGLPAMVGTLIISLYNLVDAAFVGHGVGVLGLGGIAVVFPLQILISSAAVAVGVGAGSLLSRTLGRGDIPQAQKVLGTALTMVLFLEGLFLLGGLGKEKEILELFGASRGIFSYSQDYFNIILWGAPFMGLATLGSAALRAQGRPVAAMTVLCVMGGLNVILDPVALFVFSMGIKGVALATVTSQGVASFLALQLLWKGPLFLKLSALKPCLSMVYAISGVGFSAFLRSASGSFLVAFLNHRLGTIGGDGYVAVAGLLLRLSSLGTTPVIGMAQGMQPVLGYNYGARFFERACRAIWYTLGWCTLFSALFVGIVRLWGQPIFELFSPDPLLISQAMAARAIFFGGTLSVGFQVVGVTLFQSLGKGGIASCLSLTRQLFFSFPLLFFMSLYWGVWGVWWAFPATDICTSLLTGYLLFHHRRILPGGLWGCRKKSFEQSLKK